MATTDSVVEGFDAPIQIVGVLGLDHVVLHSLFGYECDPVPRAVVVNLVRL